MTVAAETKSSAPPSHWLFVLCLIGVDYFSTLAYQTSITFKTAGLLGPMATIVVLVMTVCGALPVYWHIAGRSPDGYSSIALLQQFLRGWAGKTLVLVLLGFATTDFVVTKTLSAASAAEHILHNPNLHWQRCLSDVVAWLQNGVLQAASTNIDEVFTKKMLVTLILSALSFSFWALIHKGFRQKATRWAVVVVAAYLGLNAIVVGSGLYHLWQQPELWHQWWTQVTGGDWHMAHRHFTGVNLWTLALSSVLLFPKLALGLSGLEMTIVAMPDIGANDRDTRQRVRDTRKVMCVAAVLMSMYLLGSIVVTTLLIPPDQFAPGGAAAERALSYLAHGGHLTTGQTAAVVCPLFGEVFGTLYDVVTIVILCLAGTSVITGLTTLLPQFLLKFGMQFQWVHRWGVLFAAFALMNFGVTLAFHANVDDQRGAYATGVLVLISNACIVTVADRWPASQSRRWLHLPWGYMLITAAFVATTLGVVISTPSGLLISLCFIVVILGSSIMSRACRAQELRTLGIEFVDEPSRQFWQGMQQLDWPVLVLHRPGRQSRREKAESLREEHQLSPDLNIVLIEVNLDDPSDFYQELLLHVFREDHLYVVQIERCVSVAHGIASVALLLSKGGRPSALHFGWSEMGALEEMWSFLAFGEGNVPRKVRDLMAREEVDATRRPRVIVG